MKAWIGLPVLTALLVCACGESIPPPPDLGPREAVAGQLLPVPSAWLTEPEARYAHNIKLPNTVSTNTPFNF
ncbi:MAG: hypothetical protein Q7U84_09930, partial [Polynucleobacter sp.]|nr:hypothetical protein [Polynucleobacter sp.]